MVKKLTTGEFCSAAHKKAYHDEQDRLAVARLLEHQGQIGGLRKKKLNLEEVATAVEQGKRKKTNAKPVDAAPPAEAGYLKAAVAPREISTSVWTMQSRLVPAITMAAPQLEDLQLATCQLPSFEQPAIPKPTFSPQLPVPEALAALSLSQATIRIVDAAYTLQECTSGFPDVQSLGPIELTLDPVAFTGSIEALAQWTARPEPAGAYLFLPELAQTPEPAVAPAEEALDEDALFEELAAEGLADSQSVRIAARAPSAVAPQGQVWPVRFHFPKLSVSGGIPKSPAQLLAGAMVELDPDIAIAGQSAAGILPPHGFDSFPRRRVYARWPKRVKQTRPFPEATAEPLAPMESKAPVLRPATHAAAPAFHLWTPIRLNVPPIPLPPPSQIAQDIAQPFSAILPWTPDCKPVDVAPALPAFGSALPARPRIASVRRTWRPQSSKASLHDHLVSIPLRPTEPLSGEPKMHGALRIAGPELLVPGINLSIVPVRLQRSAFGEMSPLSGLNSPWSWEGIKNHWYTAPSDLRMIALAVPIVIAFLVLPSSPIVSLLFRSRSTPAETATASAPAPATPEKGFFARLTSDDSLTDLKRGISRRAAIELSDDFRQGLGEWSGPGNWADGWNYDNAGFIRPRKIAVYTPSLTLEDYRFEFLGQIERKALTWVFRAADIKNYYAARLEIVRPGPQPTVELVRWVVRNGKAGPKKSIPLPFAVRMDTIYRVRMDVRGTDFVTNVQGNVVDVFSDSQFPRGGVGFYSDPGEESRLRWVEVSHQYDFLGRLCAFLVPYNVSNANVRSGQ